MANDIYNISGGTDGNQNLGDIVVGLQGKTGGSDKDYVVDTEHRKTQTIADITDKWIDRLDDPRYYTGDAST